MCGMIQLGPVYEDIEPKRRLVGATKGRLAAKTGR